MENEVTLATRLDLLEKIVAGIAEKQDAEVSAVVIETESTKSLSIPTETFAFKKSKYQFKVAGIIHNGEKITAQEALEDETLLVLFVETYPKTVEKI